MNGCRISDLFSDLTQTKAKELLESVEYPWQALSGIKELILKIGPTLPKDQYDEVKENVWVAKSAKV